MVPGAAHRVQRTANDEGLDLNKEKSRSTDRRASVAKFVFSYGVGGRKKTNILRV